jgi:hypothetical protein
MLLHSLGIAPVAQELDSVVNIVKDIYFPKVTCDLL